MWMRILLVIYIILSLNINSDSVFTVVPLIVHKLSLWPTYKNHEQPINIIID